jgi:hypothetical protein
MLLEPPGLLELPPDALDSPALVALEPPLLGLEGFSEVALGGSWPSIVTNRLSIRRYLSSGSERGLTGLTGLWVELVVGGAILMPTELVELGLLVASHPVITPTELGLLDRLLPVDFLGSVAERWGVGLVGVLDLGRGSEEERIVLLFKLGLDMMISFLLMKNGGAAGHFLNPFRLKPEASCRTEWILKL